MPFRALFRMSLLAASVAIAAAFAADRPVKAESSCNQGCFRAPTGHGLCGSGNKLKNCQNIQIPGVCWAIRCGTYGEEDLDWEEVEAEEEEEVAIIH